METIDFRRHQRQMSIPSVGLEGQRRIANSSALVIGAGGLGAPVIAYLAGCGLGSLTIVDDDMVDESNLHRQFLYNETGSVKAEKAAEFALRLSPSLNVAWRFEHASRRLLADLTASHDIVIDCTDDPITKVSSAEAARAAGLPHVWGSVYRWHGQVGVSGAGGACYSCLFPPSDYVGASCALAGVLGPVCGVVGSLEAAEALRILSSGVWQADGKFVRFNGEENVMRCSTFRESEHSTHGGDEFTADAFRSPISSISITWDEYFRRAEEAAELIDVREPWEREYGVVPGSIPSALGELLQRDPSGSAQLYLYCSEGGRSLAVARRLRAAGFQAASVAGGYFDYLLRQGVPVHSYADIPSHDGKLA